MEKNDDTENRSLEKTMPAGGPDAIRKEIAPEQARQILEASASLKTKSLWSR